MATEQELQRALSQAQTNISNANIPVPTPIPSNTTPPTFSLPPEEVERTKTQYAQLFGNETGSVLFRFISDIAVEVARTIAREEVSALKREVDDLKERVRVLETTNTRIITGL